jgi:hypothetical protein
MEQLGDVRPGEGGADDDVARHVDDDPRRAGRAP